jgi:hypothetical protein
MVSLYRQAKGGEIEISLVGRLAHILNSLVQLDQTFSIDERLAALERRLDGEIGKSGRPNGKHPGDQPWP